VNAEENDERIAALLDGSISPIERHALLEAAADDPALARRLVDLLRFEPLLADAMLANENDAEGQAFIRRVQQHVLRAGDSERFITGVVERMQRRQSSPGIWRRAVAPAAAVLLLTLGLLYLARPAERFVEIEQMQGVVYVRSANQKTPARAGTSLAPGSGIETEGPGSSAVLAFADGSRILIRPQTLLSTLDLRGGGKHLELASGVISATVSPQQVAFVMATPVATVRVLGTRFVLDSRPEQTHLQVEEGLVELTRSSDAKKIQVAGGQQVLAKDGADLLVQALDVQDVAKVRAPEHVFSAVSYLGGSQNDSVVGAEIQPDGTLILAANISDAAAGGVQPVLLNGASPASSGAIVRLSPDGRKVLSVTRLAAAISDVSIDGKGNIYAACREGGLLKLKPDAAELLWQQSCGGGCERVDAGSDGTAVALRAGAIVAKDEPGTIYVFTADGKETSNFQTLSRTYDVAIDSKLQSIFQTGFKPGHSERGEIGGVAFLTAHAFDGSRKWSNYNYDPRISTTDRAHTMGVRIAIGRDGALYGLFSSVGGNSIFRHGPKGIDTRANNVAYDKYTRAFQSGNKTLAYYGRFNPEDGELILGQMLTGRASEHSRSIVVQDGDIKADESGRVYICGKAEPGAPWSPDALGGGDASKSEGFLLILAPDFSAREWFTGVTTRESSGGSQLHATAARVMPRTGKTHFATAGKLLTPGGRIAAKNAFQSAPNGESEGVFAASGE